MLSLIRVKNYAVIDEVEVEFEPGLSVMTGETGAGKSILVDALGLVLGDRADASTVRQGAERADVSAVFETPADHPALAWLREHSLDEDKSCLIRRVIGSEGRSRAFINGQPVTLQDLRALGNLLLNIHGQHAHQALREGTVQRQMLDFHGGHGALVADVAEKFDHWRTLRERLEASTQNSEDREAQLELLRFQLDELERLDLQKDELAALQSERSRLANTDRIAVGVDAALAQLYEAEMHSAHELVASARRELQHLADVDADLEPTARSVANAEIEIREVASDLARYRDRLEADPQRLEWLESRLATIAELARKHRVDDDALFDVGATLAARVAELESGNESLELLAERAQAAADDYFQLAGQLSAARAKSADSLAERVSAQLRQLGLPNGQFRVGIQPKPVERGDAHGLERIEFEVALNPGQNFGPLSKVASGGELSRISLALEVIAAGASTVPTLVFDEVDTGIGGGVAEIVGRRLHDIAADRQVLCVTHLAQVASQGDRHYRVTKLSDGTTSRTNVRALSDDERVEELSRMLGGVEITATTRAHAAEMIERAGS